MDSDPFLPPDSPARLRYHELTGRILKIFFEVYNELGAGFLESVYAAAYASLLRRAGINFARELPLVVRFRGEPIGVCKPDFVVDRAVVIECKCAVRLDLTHRAQLLNYLRATDLEVGLLLNFGPIAEFKRVISSNRRPPITP